jgi:hypothetical protein
MYSTTQHWSTAFLDAEGNIVAHLTFVPAVRSLVQRMNVPHKEEALLKMGDNVALSIKESCQHHRFHSGIYRKGIPVG